MASRICWHSARGTITSAIWKAIKRPCRTILALILTGRSRCVVSDECLIASGSARVPLYLGHHPQGLAAGPGPMGEQTRQAIGTISWTVGK
jgi:hypothetical protein